MPRRRPSGRKKRPERSFPLDGIAALPYETGSPEPPARFRRE